MRIFSILALLVFAASRAHADISIPLTVDNDKSFARINEPVASGVPIPRSAHLLSVNSLRLVNNAGVIVPAQFRILGRWDAAVNDPTRPARWVEVQFPASVSPNSQSVYTLTDTGTGNAVSGFVIEDTATQFSVNTGRARFHITKASFNLFDRVYVDINQNNTFESNEEIVAPSAANGPIVISAGREYRSSSIAPRSIVLEESGAMRAVIRVEGFHRNGADNLLRYVTRIFFYAGKSYVRVSHTIIEGRVLGQGNTDFPNIVTTNISRAGLRTRMAFNTTPAVRVKGLTTVRTINSLSASASVEQSRVTNVNAASSYSIVGDGQALETGAQAFNGWIDVFDNRAGVAFTTQDFYRKNPQRLLVQADGVVEAQIPSQPYSIYQAMGLTDDVTFFFHAAGTQEAEIRSVMEGIAVDPLFARTSGAHNRASGAFDELAPFPAPAELVAYDNLLDANFDQTRNFITQRRSDGLMNYLDMPTDRFDGSSDPDQVGRGNSYYDAGAAMLAEYARRSDVSWLKEMAFPLARHFYTTDMYDTDDTSWYQNGIGGARGIYHRGAWTGEYHYMESLWLYYYLTGDRRALERGYQAARTYAFHPNWANEFDLGVGFPGLSSRMISQKFSTMVDAFLATGDASIKAALDQQVPAYLNRMYTPEGFIAFGGDLGRNPYRVDQGWMVTQLLHPALYRYFLLTGNQQVRGFLITAPTRIAQYHRVSSNPATIDYYRFHNVVRVSVGANGNIATTPVTFGGDDFFYNSERPGLALAMMRSADLSGNSAQMQDALNILTRAVNEEGAGVFDKPGSKFTQRLGAAVGIATRASADPVPADPTPSEPAPDEPTPSQPSPDPTQPPSTTPADPAPTAMPNDPNNPSPPGGGDTPNDPGEDNNQIRVWGLNSNLSRTRLAVSIGAVNLPAQFTLTVNNRAVKIRRTSAQQFAFVVPRKRLGKRLGSVTIVLSSGRSILVTLVLNTRTGTYRQMRS